MAEGKRARPTRTAKPAVRAAGTSSARESKRLRGIPGMKPGEVAADLDRLVHERMRLAMMSALAVNRSLTFNELKDMVGATDGNLSVHARKLEEAGYVTCTKSFNGRFPRTEFELAPAGRKALERYIDHVEALIRALR